MHTMTGQISTNLPHVSKMRGTQVKTATKLAERIVEKANSELAPGGTIMKTEVSRLSNASIVAEDWQTLDRNLANM